MPTREQIRKALESEKLVERLAAIEHERWSHWQRFVHDQCESRDDGSLVIPSDLAVRWEEQIATPYVELSEREKDSDRDQVRRYLPTIVEVLTQ